MLYAVLANIHKTHREIIHFLDVDVPIDSLAALKALPAFADEDVTWTFEDMIALPSDFDLSREYNYNTETKTFELAPKPRDPVITRLKLFSRLTEQEKVLLIRPDKIADLPEQIEIALSVFATEIQVANNINLDDPAIIQGLAMLENAKLIDAGRAAEIRGISEDDGETN